LLAHDCKRSLDGGRSVLKDYKQDGLLS